jgi:hypothetical protein
VLVRDSRPLILAKDWRAFVKLKLVTAIFALVVMPALAFAQKGSPPPKGPKPTTADLQKVAEIISSDKAKLQAYCDAKKLYDQMAEAYKKNDSKTADALSKKADAFVSKLGPEYAKVMDGLQQVDPNSSEGKEFTSVISGLDKLCTGPASGQPAQASQPAPAQGAAAQPAPAQPPQPAAAQPEPPQAAPGQAVPGAPIRPCAQIREACLNAGFFPNGANMGVGIILDCIRPIMAGTPQRPRAAKPLPEIDPQLVVACKNRNPNFGMRGGPPGLPPPNPSGAMEGPDQ